MKIRSVSANTAIPTNVWYRQCNYRRIHRRILRWSVYKILSYLANDYTEAMVSTGWVTKRGTYEIDVVMI